MQSEPAHLTSILGVDIGGTFTDNVYYIPPLSGDEVGQLIVHKVQGTPKKPAQGLLTGMQEMHVAPECVIVHGSTVATNALLERKGALTALITTGGFADVLEIGRQDRPALYDIMQVRPPALIPRERRLELPEQLDYLGTFLGDMDAQMAAARIGERRLHEIIARYGSRTVQAHADALLAYSAQLTHVALLQLPDREVALTDYLDDDGWGVQSLPITVRMKVENGNLEVDFSGSADQSIGCINAVQAVTHSAVLYVVRCLVGEHVPTNQGCLEPVRIHIPEGSLLHPNVQRTGNEVQPSAAVAAGNVETSQRIVDVLFAPERIPAASQGTMNNLTFGGYDTERGKVFAYYETMGGGMGARNGYDGLSGVHVHMSNTRNTPIEASEIC